MTEQWKPIPGWEGCYEVSDQGRVRSLERKTWCPRGAGFWRTVGTKTLSPGLVRGYERVSLQRNGHLENVSVHRLVLLAFIGPCPEGMEACHNDGDKRNNHLSNLRYDTSSANHLDRNRHGSQPNILKTHCPQGHEYSPENTYWGGKHGNSRKCRKCVIRRVVERKQRIRAARKAAA